ncbi:tetratricopeptide repeat protein [Streptacidiphilus fuscans]|uniref:Tetratricopeptide repeat protein n=1 Tax=Streptacidiphilus fuscans TaxID=2789292 RepID=A0A931FF54_9ACTN|nr:tetratricopeptide repeat protein [Streptacidiphilus fuscans]MBF9071268.1 tetratricopeptide repeat protein [Streptacidiphilus fuscans]
MAVAQLHDAGDTVGKQRGALPDPGSAGDLAEFIGLLGELRAWAGMPSYRTLAKQVGPLMRPPCVVSLSTVVDVFKVNRRRLDLDLVIAIVRALGLDEQTVGLWRAAYLRIQRDAQASGPTGALRQLPADLATFTGRHAEVDRLVTAATTPSDSEPTVSVLVIEGMAGVGKTQLALHAAHSLVRSGHYADVQLYTNLRGYDPDRPPADPAAVLDSFLRQLGVAPQRVPETLEERAAMFRDRMNGRAALVVLDNAAEVSQVRELIPSSPSCLVLVTSRRSLTELPDASVLRLDVFTEQEALQLLARVAGADRVDAEPQAARRIVELTGGLPLAVALAAARLRSRPAWSVAELADRLAKGAGAEPGVTAVLDLSYQGLPKAAQRLFRLLGVDPGLDATVDSVAALVGIDPDEADQLLELLQDEHLAHQQVLGRYEMHDLVRAFAAETSRATDAEADRNAALTRWLDWYLHSVYAATDLVNKNRYRNGDLPRPPELPVAEPADDDEARAWLSAERANLLAATRFAATEGWPGHSWRYAQALWSYYFASGLNSDWAESLRHGLAAAEVDGDAAAQGELWHARGSYEVVAGRFDRALPYTREALRLRKVAGDPVKTATTLGNLACVLSDMGQFRQGLEFFHEALALMRETANGHGEANVLHNMGIGAYAMGRHRQSLELLGEALALYRESGNKDHQTFVLIPTGLNMSLLGDHDGASAAVAQAVALAEDMGAGRRLAPAINVLGTLAMERGDHEEAAQEFRRAQALAHEIGDWGEETEAWFELGVNALRSGDPAGAVTFFDEVATRLDGRKYHRWILLLPQYRADALLALGDLAGAAELYQRVLDAEDDSEAVVRARAAYGMARLARAADPSDLSTARSRLHQALRLLEKAEFPSLEQTVTATLVDVEGELEAASTR